MNSWESVKNILVVRLDNMGDLLMSSPAINALKKTFACRITLLTSSMAEPMAKHIASVDKVIVFDVPWVKTERVNDANAFFETTRKIKENGFDAAVIFSVFSQNPLPAALLITLAGIPRRLAYCRENPYGLLTDWIPDPEPFDLVRHQVKRDLDLVHYIGASGSDDIAIDLPLYAELTLVEKMTSAGVDVNRPWILFHPGVSEKKREFPIDQWMECARKIIDRFNCQIIISGSQNERQLAKKIQSVFSANIFPMTGELTLEEYIMLIKIAPLIVSVNTATVHIAAATKTKTIVLYASTNPQHTPWKTPGKVLTFPVAEHLQSKNVILQFVHQNYYRDQICEATPENILQAVESLLQQQEHRIIKELAI
jgi:lipopolysaccharide heptosyltransferase II